MLDVMRESLLLDSSGVVKNAERHSNINILA